MDQRQQPASPPDIEMVRRSEETRAAAERFLGRGLSDDSTASTSMWDYSTEPGWRWPPAERVWRVSGQVGGIGDGRAVLGKDTR